MFYCKKNKIDLNQYKKYFTISFNMKIAIAGKICSGKSTLCKGIIKKFSNINFEKRSFADGVYELAYKLFDMKEKDRNLLQAIGTNMRKIDKDVWAKNTVKNIEGKNIIIDDLRYPNEMKYLIDNDFFIIKLNISKKLQLERLKNTYPNSWKSQIPKLTHESEISLDIVPNENFNLIINCDDTKNVLETVINYLLLQH